MSVGDVLLAIETSCDETSAAAMRLSDGALLSCVVASQNDEMAMGALAALEASGKQGDMKVLGIDASPDAVALVKEGKLALTVFQDSFTQGTTAVDVALGLIDGKTYPKVVDIPFREVNQANAEEFYSMLQEWE
jgi:inositol transport system substrate-binding protein